MFSKSWFFVAQKKHNRRFMQVYVKSGKNKYIVECMYDKQLHFQVNCSCNSSFQLHKIFIVQLQVLQLDQSHLIFSTILCKMKNVCCKNLDATFSILQRANKKNFLFLIFILNGLCTFCFHFRNSPKCSYISVNKHSPLILVQSHSVVP